MSVNKSNVSSGGRYLALSALLLVDRGLSSQEALNQAIAEAARAQAKAKSYGIGQSMGGNSGIAGSINAKPSNSDDPAVPVSPGKQLAGKHIPDRERALAGELLYGCLRAESRIHFLLAHVLPRPEKLPAQLLHILALAVYSMLFQDSVPDRAAIHTAVEMAGHTFGKGLRGLANGALRSIQRLGDDLHDPEFYIRAKADKGGRGQKDGKAAKGDFGTEAIWYGLATYHGIPRFIADLWREAYGENDALALMRRSSARPWTGIRINPVHPQADEIMRELVQAMPPEPGERMGHEAERAQTREQAINPVLNIKIVPEMEPGPVQTSGLAKAKDNCHHLDHAAGRKISLGNDIGKDQGMDQGMARVGKYGLAFAPGCLPKIILGQSLDYWQADGAISFQSAGSQLVLQELGILPDGASGSQWQSAPVWDACAGVGGKSLAMLEQGITVGLATDSSRRRLAILPRQCARLGLPCPPVALANAEKPPLRVWSGNILLDVPCSGLGVLARRPDLRRRFTGRSPGQHLRGLVKSQATILEKAASLLEKGGQLAYITCTLDPGENSVAIKNLLARHPRLSLLREWQTEHDHPWLEGMYGALIG